MIAFDFETRLISTEHPYPKPVCLSTFNGWNKKLYVGMEEMREALKIVLSQTSVAHNAVFECGVIWNWFPELQSELQKALEEGRIKCTKIIQELANAKIEKPVMKRSLADLVLHYFEEDISAGKKEPDAWRLRYHELEGVPKDKWPEEAVEYSLMDSVWAYKLIKELDKFKVNSKRATESAVYLNIVGKVGICIDQNKVKQLEEEIYTILQPKYEYLIEKGFCTDIGTRRPKKNMKLLREYIEKTVPNPIYSAKKTVKTDLEALLSYLGQTQDPVFQYFKDLNDYDKVLTAFVSRLKGNSLIFTDYSTTKSTGRTSSSTSKLYPSVNIQQMPRQVPNVTHDVRNCFVPRSGYKLVSIDWSGAELITTAATHKKLFGKSAMLDMLNEGDKPVDLHSFLAAKIMSMQEGKVTTYDEFIAHKKEEKYAKMRQLCKAINLGFPGGIGYDTMRLLLLKAGIITKFAVLATAPKKYMLQRDYFLLKKEEDNIRLKQTAIDEWALVYDELVGLKKSMFKVYPELQLFLTEYHKKDLTGESKYVKDEFGQWEEEPMYRYRVEDFERDWCTYTAYANGKQMQSSVAIAITNVSIKLARKYLNHPDVNFLGEVHDETISEIKEDKIQEHEPIIAEIMIDELAKVAKGARVTCESSVMDYWSKSGGVETLFWKDAGSDKLRRG